ncbi:uncharacterized protein LOC127720486 [Mytilus californianus]|uniref:uncharacterized protein LOC127720486 n=1 Tax=Mytilus californianus TaxID=6549 RepID=UPI00224513F1|nr:uncharacterized protein LOC127720486 [Mytilus californianus]
MATCYELEVDSEAFTCLWLTQKSFNEQLAKKFKKITSINEIGSIFRKPHISVLTFSHVDSFDFIVGCHNQCKIVSFKKSIKMFEDYTKPKVVVVLLSPTRKQGICCLSEKDYKLIHIVDDVTKHPANVVYLVKAPEDNSKYNIEDLETLSDEINLKTSGKIKKNEIFKKIFLSQDDQLQVRIGACLLDSLTRILKRVHEEVNFFNDSIKYKMTDLVQKKNANINCFEKFISNSDFEICNLASQRSNRVHIRDLSKLLTKEIESKYLLVGGKLSKGRTICHLDKNIKARLDIILKKRKLFSRKVYHKLYGRTTKAAYTTLTRSMTKERSVAEVSPSSQELETKMGRTHYCLTMCSNILVRNYYKEIAKDVYTELLNFFKRCTKDLEDFLQIISDERSRRVNSLNIHEWKTIAMRNVLTKGFGCVGNNIRIYMKNNDENEKTSVSNYVKKYLNDPPGKYQLQIEYKERKITLFSKLEQGSKINKKKIATRTDKPRQYGSLGMFLEDKNGTYFFTTCAHVIGKEEHAYSPDDNSKLGQNVFIYQSEGNENDQQNPYMDFSVVQVSPERTLTCTFGLKTTGGYFISGRIFKGDLSEILERNVYKWGATTPYLRKGKCVGFEDEGSLLCLTVDTKKFAEEGDSGAIVCVGEDVDTGLAAFVIVGGSIDDSESASASTYGNSYLVYKVSDALDKVSEMRPCLIPGKRTIPISSSVSDLEHL